MWANYSLDAYLQGCGVFTVALQRLNNLPITRGIDMTVKDECPICNGKWHEGKTCFGTDIPGDGTPRSGGQVNLLVRWLLKHLKLFTCFALVFIPLWHGFVYIADRLDAIESTTDMMFYGWIAFATSKFLAGKFSDIFDT